MFYTAAIVMLYAQKENDVMLTIANQNQLKGKNSVKTSITSSVSDK